MDLESTIRICTHCATSKPLSDFKTDKRKASGKGNICKACDNAPHAHMRRAQRANQDYRANEVIAERNQREANPEPRRASARAYRERHREQIREYSRTHYHTPHEQARRQMRAAVKSGKLIRPDTCSDCGASGRIEGHHEDYSKPLEVTWLCLTCHGKQHRKYIELETAPDVAGRTRETGAE